MPVMQDCPASQPAGGSLRGELVVRHPDELRLHPSLEKLGIGPLVRNLAVAISQSQLRVEELITITQENYVLSRLAHWRFATTRSVTQVHCRQLPLDEEEALI